MKVLINTNEDKSVQVDGFGATKKIEKVVVRCVLNKEMKLVVTGEGLISVPVEGSDKTKPMLYHRFNFGILEKYSSETIESDTVAFAKSKLGEGFEVEA